MNLQPLTLKYSNSSFENNGFALWAILELLLKYSNSD
jgi:hypothetical protein